MLNDPSIKTLVGMLSYMRPADSITEEMFISKYITPLGTTRDTFGNHYLRIGDNPHILWSSHTDTVHGEEGRQAVRVDDGIVSRVHKSPQGTARTCLGADCTTGVWLMREMILARVPGLYVFHREEEIGGLGSDYIARQTPDLLTGIDIAIAFDRRGGDSVVTHQFGGRTASETFACQLASLLGGDYAPDDTGTFTDTSNYSTIVSECTNISVGYAGAHTAKETQDLAFAMHLRDTLLLADWSELKAMRDPDAVDKDQAWWMQDNPVRSWREPKRVKREHRLERFCYDHPEIVADFLEANGYAVFDLEDHGEASGVLSIIEDHPHG